MEKLPITREQAIDLLKSMPQQESDMNHYLETEVIMRALADKFGEDVEYWGMIGLLHDVDWALTRDNCQEHCIRAVEILESKGFDDGFIRIVQSHGYGHEIIPTLISKKRTKKIEYALVSAETLTGVIYAYALMRGKTISDMDAKGVMKKFKDKKFAANCNRELIREIEKTGLSLEELFDLSIKAMQGIKTELGLK